MALFDRTKLTMFWHIEMNDSRLFDHSILFNEWMNEWSSSHILIHSLTYIHTRRLFEWRIIFSFVWFSSYVLFTIASKIKYLNIDTLTLLTWISLYILKNFHFVVFLLLLLFWNSKPWMVSIEWWINSDHISHNRCNHIRIRPYPLDTHLSDAT